MTATAGWYDDPEDSSRLRYFDGTAWTENVSLKPPSAQPPPPSHAWVKWLVIGIVALVLVMFAGCAVAISSMHVLQQAISDTTSRAAEKLVNSDISLPNGKYVIPEATSAGAGEGACVLSGAAVPTDVPLQGESSYVTLGALGALCEPVGVASGPGPSDLTVEFTVKDNVAEVTRVRPSGG